jgi:hypothetical protein
VNHFKPKEVSISDSALVDDSLIVPDWIISSLSLCGHIRVLDPDFNLRVLKPNNDPLFSERGLQRRVYV